MPRRLALAIFATAALLGFIAQAWSTEPAQAPPVPGKPATSLRCDDWKKVGAHRWMVVKEVMLGTARRTGTIVENTPETAALDAKCAK